MRHKRLDNYIICDADGKIIGRAKNLSPDVANTPEQYEQFKSVDVPEEEYIDRIDHDHVAIMLGPGGKFISMYAIQAGEMFEAKDLPE